MFGALQQNAAPQNPNNDLIVANGPTDGISCVKFSPVSNLLVAGSWDNQIRCWDVQASGATMPKAAQTYAAPILTCAWSSDGMRVFSGGCDKQVKCWDLATNQATQVGVHDAPVRHMFWLPEMNCVVTGSWDKTIKYWDCRSATPACSVQMPERVYCMDATVRAAPHVPRQARHARSRALRSACAHPVRCARAAPALDSGDRRPQDHHLQPRQAAGPLPRAVRLAAQVPEPLHRKLHRQGGLLPRLGRGARGGAAR